MCFKKKAPAASKKKATATSSPTQTQEQAVEQQQIAAEEVKQEEVAATREQKTADIFEEVPLTQEQIKLGRRGGTGRRSLLISGAGGAGYLDRFGQTANTLSRMWG